MTWRTWLAGSGVALCVVVACSGSDGKKVVREAGGAGGDEAELGAGGSQMSDGGAGSATAGVGPDQAGAGASANEAGAGGAATNEAGAGGAATNEAGAGGGPSLSVDLAALEGTWTGQVLASYVCESGLEEIELTIEGSTVSSTWPSAEDLGTGEIVHQAGQSFTFGLFIDNPNFNQNYRAQLFVDPTATYALLVALAQHSDGPANSIDMALLQKTELMPLEAEAADYLGDWSGPTFALDADLAIARKLDATAAFTSESNGDVTGQDDDGAFSGVLEPTQFASGVWVVPSMQQGANELGGIFLLSNDKQAMGVALLRELDETNGALCDLSDPFVDMSVHKFGLWTKVPE
jgi:hypothetical protein